MNKDNLKAIGTCHIDGIDNLSTNIAWEPVETSHVPFQPILSEPKGYICTYGSACASMATTSREGWKYVLEFYNYRLDGVMIDRDRYIGSFLPNGDICTYMVPKSKTPHHNIDPTNPPSISLPQSVKRIIAKV